MIKIALPKGRLGDRAYSIFKKAGWYCPEMEEENRKLIFTNTEQDIQFFWSKPGDVGTYVERGAADIGVVGKDILQEDDTDVYELLDLGIGKCYMAVASMKGKDLDEPEILRVATKYPETAKRFFQSKGRDIDIIKLNGSIEIAPVIDLSDCIVDIVETGTTLRENDLEVREKVFDISARLIVNRISYRFQYQRIQDILEGIRRVVDTDDKDN